MNVFTIKIYGAFILTDRYRYWHQDQQNDYITQWHRCLDTEHLCTILYYRSRYLARSLLLWTFPYWLLDGLWYWNRALTQWIQKNKIIGWGIHFWRWDVLCYMVADRELCSLRFARGDLFVVRSIEGESTRCGKKSDPSCRRIWASGFQLARRSPDNAQGMCVSSQLLIEPKQTYLVSFYLQTTRISSYIIFHPANNFENHFNCRNMNVWKNSTTKEVKKRPKLLQSWKAPMNRCKR